MAEVNQLLLVKHAMPTIRRDVAAKEWLLSPEGELASLQLAQRLVSYKPMIIYASNEPKATKTAEVIAGNIGVPSEVALDLHEHERNGVPWMNNTEYNTTLSRFFDSPSTLIFGQETADEAYERFQRSITALVSKGPSHNTVVVSHGTVISLFVARMNEIDAYSIWTRLGLPSFVVLEWPTMKLLEIVNLVLIADSSPTFVHA